MTHEQVLIPTKDGICPTHVLTPEGPGSWPVVIFYMDALGIRPALVEMAARLAGSGYVVLLPDLYYRFGAYTPLDPREVFKGDFRAIIGPMRATTGNEKAIEDTMALLAYADARKDVAGSRIGAVGFCMGGAMALILAGILPDRVAASASFHGGNLATDEPGSPHLLAPQIKAEIYVAGADNDGSYPLAMAERLDKALSDGQVRHVCEIYAGAAHGWMMPDVPIYHQAAAERGWTELVSLFGRAIR